MGKKIEHLELSQCENMTIEEILECYISEDNYNIDGKIAITDAMKFYHEVQRYKEQKAAKKAEPIKLTAEMFDTAFRKLPDAYRYAKAHWPGVVLQVNTHCLNDESFSPNGHAQVVFLEFMVGRKNEWECLQEILIVRAEDHEYVAKPSVDAQRYIDEMQDRINKIYQQDLERAKRNTLFF